jgi:hypothetical protein
MEGLGLLVECKGMIWLNLLLQAGKNESLSGFKLKRRKLHKFDIVQLRLYNCRMKEYIAYKGRAFQIEWYFSENGKSQPLAYAEELDQKDKKKLENLLRLMGEVGKIQGQDKFRNEGDQIFAFKPQPHRFLCFFIKGKKIIITNAFQKK